METYSFWQDFFATYRSSPDIIKALWLIVPPTFAAVIAWLVLKASGGKTTANRSAFNVTLDATGEERPVQNRSNEQVLVFVAGRLLDRYEVPAGPDDTTHWQRRQVDER